MKKFILIFCLVLSSCAIGADFWSTNSQKISFGENLKLVLVEEARFSKDNINTYIQYAGVEKKINDSFSAAVLYKLVLSKKNNDYIEKQRFTLDGVLKKEIFSVHLSNRYRLERCTTDNLWIYRNKVKISKKLKFFDKSVTTFIYDEFFVSIKPDSGLTENRLGFGISTKFIGNSSIICTYMIRDKDKKNGWDRTDVINVGLKFTF